MEFKNSVEAIKMAVKVSSKYLDDLNKIEDDQLFLDTTVNIGLHWIYQAIKIAKNKEEICLFLTDRITTYYLEMMNEK